MTHYAQFTLATLAVLSLASPHAAMEPERATASRSFTISLHAPVDAALAAFGPTQESKWAPDWAPRFITVSGPVDDPDFAVFETGSEEHPTLWTLTQHDRQRHHIQYVSVQADALHTVIDVDCATIGPGLTRATVTYRRTALRTVHNPAVEHFAEHFASQADHWQDAINRYLERR
jgi:hypothetical protein